MPLLQGSLTPSRQRTKLWSCLVFRGFKQEHMRSTFQHQVLTFPCQQPKFAEVHQSFSCNLSTFEGSSSSSSVKLRFCTGSSSAIIAVPGYGEIAATSAARAKVVRGRVLIKWDSHGNHGTLFQQLLATMHWLIWLILNLIEWFITPPCSMAQGNCFYTLKMLRVGSLTRM